MFTSDVAQVSAAFFLWRPDTIAFISGDEPVRTLMLTIASSLYIDKLPLADGENEYASHTVFFDNFDVFYFGSLVRARMDRVRQPRRQILVPFPGTTKSNRNHLSIGIRSRPPGALL